MTTREMRTLAFAWRTAEQAEFLLIKIMRLRQECDRLAAKGETPMWLSDRRAALIEQEARAKRILAESASDKAYFEVILDSCPDRQIEQILRLRYQKQYDWRAIAQRLGGGNSAESVRKRACRYLAGLSVRH